MTKTPAALAPPRAPLRPAPAAATPRWLLFVHQLPATPSNLRVRTWRRLQQIGALPVKQAVYALPDSPAAREDFEWLRSEVKGSGGDATVFVADAVDRWTTDALVDEFRRARQEAYAALAADIDQALGRVAAKRRPRGTRAPAVGRLADGFRERLSALERIDFFGSAGRDRVVSLLARLDEKTRRGRPAAAAPADAGPLDRADYLGRLWVTRPRPGVDRMSSAWLIRRFVDGQARFAFAADRESLPSAAALPFDMFGVEFSHHGDDCTFETLCRVFGIDEPAVARIAAIVHDLDLKDGRFGAAEAATVGALIDGLQRATDDDGLLLERGITLFESLYQSFGHAERPPRPRAVAGTRSTRRGQGPSRRQR
ncbi:MAG: chromate resistance protein ChrB domain-containing protein [Vicinamibacterales bacterium]